MASVNPVSPFKSPKYQIELIPWDPKSPQHVQRLVQQRITCGWDSEAVEGWRAAQESGKMNLQWIILAEADPEIDIISLKHVGANPEEKDALLDSALAFGGKPRSVPSPQRSFIPIGHVSLGRLSAEYENAGYVKRTEGLYWISIIYISRALQGGGLGRAAMDMVENLAISEPLFAKTLALNAIDKVDPDREEKYKALGLTIPPFSNQEWYERRGYQVINHVEKLFSKVDSTGKEWYWNAVFLKKDI